MPKKNIIDRPLLEPRFVVSSEKVCLRRCETNINCYMAVTLNFDWTSNFYCYLKGKGSIAPYQTGKWCNEYVAKCSSMNAGSYTLE